VTAAASRTHPTRPGQRSFAGAPRFSPGRRWVPTAAGYLCALAGLLNIGSAVTPEFFSRLREITRVVPGAVTHAAVAATAVTGLLLVLLAHGLRRRKQRAWGAVAALLAASVVLHVLKGLDVEEALVAAAMLAALVHYRGEFYAAGDPRTRWSALGVFVALGLASVLVGLLLLRFRAGPLVGPHPLSAQLRQVLLGLVGVQGPLRFGGDLDADLVGPTLLSLGTLTGVTTAYLALRPARPVAGLSADDERRMRDLLGRHGCRDSLGYFALRRDKSVIWSRSGKAAIAYRVVSGVMLAGGDPLGDVEAWPAAIDRFLAEAARHAWTPAVMGCSEIGGEVWARAGLDALEIGDEAVVELAEFSLSGRAMRGVRQAVARIERTGCFAEVRRVGDIPAAELADLRARAAAWRDGHTERGFSMALGRFGDPADADCVAVQAMQQTPDGPVLRAFLHFVPWGADGLSLDLMRRDRDADNGINEYLIVAALRAAPELGVRRLSLNFAVFRSALERGERLGAGPVLRAWRGLLIFASRWFQIESLYRFNAKFRPVWEPRYVCYPSARDLPRISVAALEAEAFIVWPAPALRRLRRLLRARPRQELPRVTP
jgi:lysyl-tRNA synthetase class 2